MKRQVRIILLIIMSVILLISGSCTKHKFDNQNWTHFARIAGHGVNQDNIDEIISSATETNVFGIEIDNSLTGYYSSFLNPEEKLQAIKMAAEAAHAVDNFAFIYTEGLEIITSDADKKDHTFFKDHHDWVQRNIDGEPAVFGSEHAFWISEGDEDVWISPFADEWRTIYMKRIRQLAETGIDGIFIDIPYWMTHFKGWEDSWASFDDYTVEAFRRHTGLNAKTDISLGDYSDPNFIKWIDFRIDAITGFMEEVNRNVKTINPNCMTIAEIYPGLDEAVVRVGSDVYELYEVVDVITHEYSEGGYTAAKRDPFDWVTYMAGMHTFRSFAGDKATWMLSYSWDNEENIDKTDAMKNLVLSHLMTGTNTWDSRGHVMSGSNDLEMRKVIFEWVDKHKNIFYKPREVLNPVGIYFSPKSRNYFPDTYIKSFFGYMHLALTSHREFEVVTPRTLDDFSGQILILPNVQSLSDDEINELLELSNTGVKFIISGSTGNFDEHRNSRSNNTLLDYFMIDVSNSEPNYDSNNQFIYYKSCPGLDYFQKSGYEYNINSRVGWYKGTSFYSRVLRFEYDLDRLALDNISPILEAPPYIVARLSIVSDKPHFFLTNLKGLEAEKNAQQKLEKNIKILIPNNNKISKVFFLPFLGEISEIKIINNKGNLFVNVPPVDKGAVIWYE